MRARPPDSGVAEHVPGGAARSGGVVGDTGSPQTDGLGPPVAGLGAIALVCLGTLLRVYNFWAPELWIDEYATRWVVADVTWSEAARRAIHAHGQSPFYYVIVKGSCALLGVNAFSLRLPSVLFGIGVVALAYPLGIKLFRHREVALFAVGVFAVNEQLIWYAQQARPYSLALFCTLLSFLAYAALRERDRPRWRVAYVLSTAGVFYAQFLFGFVVIVHVLHLFLIRGGSWLRSRAWPLTFLGVLLLCVPGIPQLASLFARRATLNWLPPAHWLAPLELASGFLDAPGLGLVALAVLLAGFSVQQFRALRGGASLLLVWFVLPICVFRVVPPLFGVSMFLERYLAFALPAALLLTAGVMGLASRQTWRRWVPLAVYVLVSFAWYLIPAFAGEGTFVPHSDQGWSRAVPALERAARSGDVVLYSTGFVEADQLSLPDPDPLVVSFIQSPLTANLSPGRTLSMIGLPFRFSARTLPYVSSVMERAGRATRVWVIGIGEPSGSVAAMLVRDASLRVASEESYGSVMLVLLEPSGR